MNLKKQLGRDTKEQRADGTKWKELANGNINPTISVITLNINVLSQLKDKDCHSG